MDLLRILVLAEGGDLRRPGGFGDTFKRQASQILWTLLMKLFAALATVSGVLD